ncbi:hypothetical protein HMPREF0262_01122 [Clostridium sp. ATCC 29733]|nr:hypothetical protein HMPREF0262_01122 [Clostridium sp. ATCC 29733]
MAPDLSPSVQKGKSPRTVITVRGLFYCCANPQRASSIFYLPAVSFSVF